MRARMCSLVYGVVRKACRRMPRDGRVGVCLCLLSVTGCAAGLNHQFTPAKGTKVDARPTPAALTAKDEHALIAEGYYKLGQMEVSSSDLSADAGVRNKIRSRLLELAGREGGDLVALELDAELKEFTAYKDGKCLYTDWRTVTVRIPKSHRECITLTGGQLSCRTVSDGDDYRTEREEYCKSFERVAYSAPRRVSVGTVWRYDPAAPLAAAVSAGDLVRMKELLARGVPVDARGENGWTALHLAAGGCKLRVMEELLVAGADPNARQVPYGTTPLICASSDGCAAGVRRLLEAGADKNGADYPNSSFHRSALGWAAREGKAEAVKALLTAGADVNINEQNGWTPLMNAAFMGHLEVVRQLIVARANLNAQDKKGRTALSIAIEENRAEVAKALRGVGAR